MEPTAVIARDVNETEMFYYEIRPELFNWTNGILVFDSNNNSKIGTENSHFQTVLCLVFEQFRSRLQVRVHAVLTKLPRLAVLDILQI